MFASWTHAAGFDCNKASTLVEKAICSDSELSKLYDLLMISYKGIYSDLVYNFLDKQTDLVTTQSVTISTIHSIKGFDYACVFVIGLDWLDETRWTAEQAKKLTYVAITRARERLFISHIYATDICKKCREIAR